MQFDSGNSGASYIDKGSRLICSPKILKASSWRQCFPSDTTAWIDSLELVSIHKCLRPSIPVHNRPKSSSVNVKEVRLAPFWGPMINNYNFFRCVKARTSVPSKSVLRMKLTASSRRLTRVLIVERTMASLSWISRLRVYVVNCIAPASSATALDGNLRWRVLSPWRGCGDRRPLWSSHARWTQWISIQ